MFGKLFKSLIGLALIGAGAYAIYLWWPELLVLAKGIVGLVLILGGLVAFALAAD